MPTHATPAALARALGHEPTAPQWRTTSVPPVPIERFGQDHWSTFAYVETRTVDYSGLLDHNHMRCDVDRHPVMFNAKWQRMGFPGGGKYPTRLKGLDDASEDLHNHDDYDCLDDLIAAGLLAVTVPDAPRGALVTGLVELELCTRARWSLTERGQQVAQALRAHKADGGNFRDFVPPSAA